MVESLVKLGVIADNIKYPAEKLINNPEIDFNQYRSKNSHIK